MWLLGVIQVLLKLAFDLLGNGRWERKANTSIFLFREFFFYGCPRGRGINIVSKLLHFVEVVGVFAPLGGQFADVAVIDVR